MNDKRRKKLSMKIKNKNKKKKLKHDKKIIFEANLCKDNEKNTEIHIGFFLSYVQTICFTIHSTE